MANYSSTPRPAYVWDGVNNQWVPIGVGAHTHTTSDVSNIVPVATSAANAAIANIYAVGPTSSRPTSPAIGFLYFDTTLQQMFNYTTYGWLAAGVVLPVVTGGTLTSDATYYYRTFTSTGTLTVNNAPLTADILVVAGGGGGGSEAGGGEGAGGLRTATSQSLSLGTSYTAVVGAGGAGVYHADGASGSSSSFNGLNATGGGHDSFLANGTSGGSGAGGGGANGTTGGAGNAGSYSPVEGYAGGNGSTGSGSRLGGGGGGAGGVGGNYVSTTSGGAGGVGATSALINAMASATGTGQNVSGTYYYAGGGGGGSNGSSAGGGAGGYGGGGAGGSVGVVQLAGTANTGGGAGGTGPDSPPYGVNGGSGIVIVRYTRSQVGG